MVTPQKRGFNFSEEGVETSLEQLLTNYAPITEKIIVEQVTIPYETVTKNSTGTDKDTTNKVLQQGEDGLKEITKEKTHLKRLKTMQSYWIILV